MEGTPAGQAEGHEESQMWDELLALTAVPGSVLRVGIADGRMETLVQDAGSAPDGIVVEAGVVYWTTMGTPTHDPAKGSGEAAQDFSRRNGGVHAVRLDGSGRRDVVEPGAITTGKQLASDGAGFLYWGDREGCRVSRVRTDGSGLSDLVVNPPGDIAQECVGVAVDPVRGHLYWTQKGPAKGGQGRIFRCGLELPAGESPERRSDIELLWTGLPEPIDLHLDGDWLYWTDRGAPPAGNTLNRAPVPAAGAPGGTPQILAGGFAETIGLAVDDDAGTAYVSDLGGHIRAVPLPGGPADGRGEREIVSLPHPLTGIAGIS
ncbi:hypothetical protein ACIBJF_14225 [Streptomyces sp. NPDC050743]|uniref:hypothetical protein n=1 Tax=Streptomyces sp. NPDC050743 TaxID=3365634 RepID=UPI00378E80DA